MVPQTTQHARSSAEVRGSSAAFRHARLTGRLTALTTACGRSYLRAISRDLRRPGLLNARTSRHGIVCIAAYDGGRALDDSIGLYLDGEHEKLVVKDGNVDQSLLELGLCSLLEGGERWLAVLFGVLENRVNDIVLAAHLDCLEKAFLFAHVLEDVGLQVAVEHKYGAAGYVFEGLLESFKHLLHRVECRLA